VPVPNLRIFEQRRVPSHDLEHRTDAVRVVSDDEPVEWARKLDTFAMGRGDLLAAGKTKSFFGTDPDPEGHRIERIASMYVGVTPVDAGRERPAGVRRIAGFLQALGYSFLVDRYTANGVCKNRQSESECY